MKRLATSALLALTLIGCGATPPQAPFRDAQKLDSATSDISTACGENYQLTAFPGAPRSDFVTLEATASAAAEKLASIYHRGPQWIYQGDTVREIVDESLAMLRACGLDDAANALARATGRK